MSDGRDASTILDPQDIALEELPTRMRGDDPINGIVTRMMDSGGQPFVSATTFNSAMG